MGGRDEPDGRREGARAEGEDVDDPQKAPGSGQGIFKLLLYVISTEVGQYKA
jgi:hypothetical protein